MEAPQLPQVLRAHLKPVYCSTQRDVVNRMRGASEELLLVRLPGFRLENHLQHDRQSVALEKKSSSLTHSFCSLGREGGEEKKIILLPYGSAQPSVSRHFLLPLSYFFWGGGGGSSWDEILAGFSDSFFFCWRGGVCVFNEQRPFASIAHALTPPDRRQCMMPVLHFSQVHRLFFLPVMLDFQILPRPSVAIKLVRSPFFPRPFTLACCSRLDPLLPDRVCSKLCIKIATPVGFMNLWSMI